jgi:catechol 2,3-dioxygenase-like lactoylglutathione lyase family enzyme
MAKRPPRFRGIRHVAFNVENLEECEKFYTDIMGMKLLWRAHDDLVYLTCGNDNLSLARAKRKPAKGGTLDHYGFIVGSKADLNRWHTYMQEEGVTLLDEPHDHRDGARSFHCVDPAGNVIQPIYHPAISKQKFTSPA